MGIQEESPYSEERDLPYGIFPTKTIRLAFSEDIEKLRLENGKEALCVTWNDRKNDDELMVWV